MQALIPTDYQKMQYALLAWSISENPISAGVVLCPLFSYNKGKVWMEEVKMLQELSKSNHNIDHCFSMPLRDRQDARDTRPMCMHGRFVFSSPLQDIRKCPFFLSDLCQNGRTPDVKQLPAKTLKEIEDISPEALPPSTNLRDNHIAGANKFCQLGPDAWSAVLQSSLEADGTNVFENVQPLTLWGFTVEPWGPSPWGLSIKHPSFSYASTRVDASYI